MPRSPLPALVPRLVVRRSTRLFSSSGSEDVDARQSATAKATKTKTKPKTSKASTINKKRKAPSSEPTRAIHGSRRRGYSTTNEMPEIPSPLEETVSNDAPLLSLDIENADRKMLQTLAKQHGMKANQKSDILRADLLAILSGKQPQGGSQSVTLPTPSVKTTASSTSANETSPKSKRSPAKKKSPKKTSAATIENTAPPDGWLEIYQLVEELRADRSAPVDTDGSEALPQRQHGLKTYRFQVLVALMLSSQTKDAVVGETMRRLQQHGLTVENIHHHTTHEQLNELIRKAGFHNNKTKFIKSVVEILLDKYDGDIPLTAEELIELPGVGPKMAYIVENVAWNKTTGIGIDTHMHRMFNQLKWVKSKNPEQTRKQLEAWLPNEYWSSVNLLWVGFGQEVQQQKAKMLRKALDSSRPKDALKLINRLGLDYRKEGEKLGLKEEVTAALQK